MLGAIVGDIVGSHYEEFNVKSTDFDFFPSGSTYTDDTVMTLAIADWLLRDDNHSTLELIRSMKVLGNRHLGAGYGRLFYCWLRNPNSKPYGSYGNGAAMRVSPIGLYAKSIDDCLRLAELSASVTHNHPEAIIGAQAIACSVFLAKQGISKREIKQYVEAHFGYDLGMAIESIRPNYTFDSSAVGSVPVAIISFLQGDSLEQVIRLAISVGGDSDTIASMAAAIAACTYEIPQELEDQCLAFLDRDLLLIHKNFCEEFCI